MRDFFDWLVNNPLLLIILVGWLLSMVGNVMTRAAQKAARRQQQAQQQERQRSAAAPGSAQSPARTPAGPPPGPRDPQEIAGEIRRIMGLEEQRRAGAASAAPPPSRRPAAPPPHERPPTRRRGNLEAELAQKEAQRARVRADHIRGREAALGTARDRADAMGQRIRDRHLAVHVGEAETKKQIRRRTAVSHEQARVRLLDLHNLAAVFVGREVFGPPRALRGWDDGYGGS